MTIDTLVSSLHSRLRRDIIQILCEKDLSASDIYKKLKDRPKFRQSIHRSLELLVDSGLVEKYYNRQEKRLFYRIVKKQFKINLEQMSLE